MNPITDGHLPSMRLWGEEEHIGAIYTVYLKKVRYHPSKDISGEVVAHLEWETVRVRVIKAGTLEKLVESLATDSGELEPTYVNIFLSTYRSFATSQQVLTLLLDRYIHLCDKKVVLDDDLVDSLKITLSQVLLLWLDGFPEDFFQPPQFLLLHQLVEFGKKYLPDSILLLRAQHRLDKFLNDDLEGLVWANAAFTPEAAIHSVATLHTTFLDVPEKHFAYQLTCLDAELFKKLVPHHCLGSIWSQRERKTENILPSSVTATIDQFNAVSYRVISTILSDPSLSPYIRAKIISKWITLAQELRFLKNFSSLKAITAALQCSPIYRLKKVWLMVSNDKIEAFSELARIFAEDNNQINCRKLLLKEGSAKFADTVGINDRQLQKALNKQLSESSMKMQGTIPYLGTFLTDLMMIDTALPDSLPNGFVNFDKRRKEFEVLAQIKLLQSAANNYDISPDKQFQFWFDSIPVLEDTESYQLSCLIEPLASNTSEKNEHFQKNKSLVARFGHQKSDSTSSTSSSSSQFNDQFNSECTNSLLNDTLSAEKLSKSSSSLSLPFLMDNQYNPNSKAQEYYVIRVSLDQNCTDIKGGNLYKSIMLSNTDRTHTVITNAMMKHGITGDPEQYILSQLVPGGEIIFPSSANVFYAVNSTYDLNFILRTRQGNEISSVKKNKPHFVKRFFQNTP